MKNKDKEKEKDLNSSGLDKTGTGKEGNERQAFGGKRFGSKRRHNGRGKNSKYNGESGRYRKGMFNDISFYTKNPEITKAFCKLPFSFIVGSRIPNLEAGQSEVSSIVSFIVDWLPSTACKSTNVIGTTPSIMDQAKTIVYTAMRRANSGSTNNIEPVDVFTSNLLASIDILCNAVNFHRVFKIANSFSWKNRIIPREIFHHLGLNYDDFIENQANYRGRFDTLVAFAKTIRTLANFPFIQAAYAEYDNIFKDEDTDTGREQLIIPVKAFHHIYDPVGTTANPGGTVRLMTEKDLDPSSSTDNTIYTAGNGSWAGDNFSKWLNILETQISALVNDSDFNLIQADIEKAFGEQGGYIETDKVSSDVVPIDVKYSAEFLEMFHNGTFLPVPGTAASISAPRVVAKNEYCNTIYQIPSTGGTGGTQFGFQMHVVYPNASPALNSEIERYVCFRANNYNVGALMDTNENDPNEEHVIVMSRYKYCAQSKLTTDIPTDFRLAATGPHGYFTASAASNFIVFGNLVSSLTYAPGTTSISISRANWDSVPSPTAGTLPGPQALVLQVNHGPMVMYKSSSQSYVPMFELNNVRYISSNELTNVNESCFLSLWDVPSRTNI